VFNDEQGQQRPCRDAWFSTALQDEATFAQIISNSALHMEIMRRGRDNVCETPDSMRYYTRAIVSVRNRVGTAKREKLEAIIGTVTGMMAHAVRSVKFHTSLNIFNIETAGYPGK